MVIAQNSDDLPDDPHGDAHSDPLSFFLNDPDGQLGLFAQQSLEKGTSDSLACALKWLEDVWQYRITGGLDSFAYTDEFVDLFEDFCQNHGQALSTICDLNSATTLKNGFWRVLLRLRKAKRLSIGIGQKRADAPKVVVSDREMTIIRLRIGLPAYRADREGLPYTPLFDELFKRFGRECRQAGFDSPLSDHEFWRAIVRVMKSTRSIDSTDLF